MDKDSITIVVSICSALTSIATFTIAYSQLRIASAKTKLDLYNKRFNIYLTALNYYHATCYESFEKIKEKAIVFNQSYRESQFLFNPKDGIYDILGKIQNNGSKTYGYEQHIFKRDNNLTHDKVDLSVLHTQSVDARSEFTKNLVSLEIQMKKYLQFRNITGWHFLK